MKVTVEIDCTPDEARRFLGLPDVASMQDAVMAQIQGQIQSAMAAATPEALARAWMPMPAFSPEQMAKAFTGFVGSAFGGKPGPSSSG